MEWLREQLKAAGIDEAAIEKIISNAGKELPKYFIPKDKYNEIVEAKKQAEKDVADRDKQIEELGKTAGLSDELKQQIATLQAENKAAKEKYEADLKELKITNAIKTALAGKVHDEDLVAGLFDKSKLVIDGDKVVGLDEQLKGIRESKAFLFKNENQQSGFKLGSDGKGTGAIGNEQLAAIFGNLK